MSREVRLQTRSGEIVREARSIGKEAEDRLSAVLAEWEGTPYVEGACMAGMGADCFRALAGVIADMGRTRPETFGLLPADAAMHAPETARAAMRAVIRAYDAEAVTGPVEPGDLIVTAPPGHDTGPGHASILDPRFRLWHMDRRRGFCQTGHSLHDYRLVEIYRVPKESWESRL